MATVEPPEILQGEEPRMTYQEWVKTKEGQEATKGKYTEKVLDNGDEGGIIDVITVPEFTDNKAYNEILTDLKNYQIEYTPVIRSESERNEKDIITKICGGDETKGSCASVAIAYVGQKKGLNVLDYRDGQSRKYFSMKQTKIKMFKALGASPIEEKTYKTNVANGKKILSQMEKGKEYYLSVGCHAAIVKLSDDGKPQYLELQSDEKWGYKNGWHDFSDDISTTLRERFGCKSSSRYYNVAWLTDIEQFSDNAEFRTLLGFINTNEENQRKGKNGGIK